MQRVCFCKTVSLFNHVLQPSQALALFYQTLLFSLKNFSLIKWISNNVDIPVGLQLLMIDINGNVTIDNDLFSKQLLNRKSHAEQQKDTTSILNWISRIVLRLATDFSVSSKSDRSPEFETLNEFLKQFHSTSTNDHATLSDNDEEDINRHAIHRALIKCIDYIRTNSFDNLNTNLNSTEMQDLESSPIAVYNQQILQILCSDTLELEIELARESQQSSFEILPHIPTNDNKLTNYYSIWAASWRNVTAEYLQFNEKKCLRKVSIDKFNNESHRWSLKESDYCLHDRLMLEIKQKRRLQKSLTTGSIRKRIRPIKALIESDCSSDDECRDKYGRKRVAVVDCLLESSSSVSPDDQNESKKIFSKTNASINKKRINYSTIENLELEHISMEKLLRLMKESSDVLSLTFDEFCHIRNVITRAELETLLFDEKLYTDVAQGKLCFTCRKVHFNILKFTFGIQCNVCKQKICRNCVTQIVVPKERLNDLPIQAFTPLTLAKTLLNSEKCHSFDTQSPGTPTMNDVLNDSGPPHCESRRCSTPGQTQNQSGSAKCSGEPIDICTDCFFLLQQIRKKSRQRHVSPAVTSNLPSSSSSFNRSHHSSSHSASNYNLSSSSSASSIAALLAHQQQQRSLMVKTTSVHANLKQAKSAQELSTSNDPLQTLATLAAAAAAANGPTERVSLSRRHLFLKLQPTYDVKLNNVKTG